MPVPWILRLAVFTAALMLAVSPVVSADVFELRPGEWSGGTGLGFMGSGPDGTEFAIKGHADYFLTPKLSVGVLGQYAGADNDMIFGLSAQAKYWMSLSDRAKLVFQGGLGFVRAGVLDDNSGFVIADTYGSFLIPVGVGLDYALTRRLALTADFILNFTSLGQTYRQGGAEADLHTNVMPTLYLGVRF